jgi:CTP:molybdopterin cytidylyltransferase MocA
VVLGSDAEEIARIVEMHGAEPIVCPDWIEGQAASLCTGVDALDHAGA